MSHPIVQENELGNSQYDVLQQQQQTFHLSHEGVKQQNKEIPFSTVDERRNWDVCEKLQVRSSVWKHFWVYKDRKFGGAVCKHCYLERHQNPRYTAESWEVKYGGTESANTSHLVRHFRAHHKNLYIQEQNEAGLVAELPETKKKRNSTKGLKLSGEVDRDEREINPEVSIPTTVDGLHDIDSCDSQSISAADTGLLMPTTKKAKVDNSFDLLPHSPGDLHQHGFPNQMTNSQKDYQLAWSCITDQRKCLYPNSVSLPKLLDDMSVHQPQELDHLDKEQIQLFCLALKPAPRRAFLQALQIND